MDERRNQILAREDWRQTMGNDLRQLVREQRTKNQNLMLEVGLSERDPLGRGSDPKSVHAKTGQSLCDTQCAMPVGVCFEDSKNFTMSGKMLSNDLQIMGKR